MWREVFIYESQDLFANVGRHIKAVWWVEPNDLSTSASSRSLDCRGNDLSFSVMSTASKGSAVRWYCFVKLFLIARQGLDPVCDGFRKLFNDVRGMVRFGIDIQEVVVRLLLRPKLATPEIKIYIKKICVVVQGLDCNS